jgi:hypothetical protein
MNIILKISINQIMVMLDLLHKSLPCGQLLVELGLPNTHHNVLLPASCSD